MPRKRGKGKKSETTSIIAALVATKCDASVCQLHPRKMSSDQIGQTLPESEWPRSILALGKHLYVFTTYGNLEEPMEFYRMHLSEGDQTWNQLTPMPTPRNDFATAACNGKIYFVGGMKEKKEVANTVERYCPDNGKWETIESLLAPRCLSRLVVCQDRLYCLGGLCPGYDTVKSVQMFDPKKYLKKKDPEKTYDRVWEHKKSMICERFHFAAVAIEGNIYALGGLPDNAHCSLETIEVYKADEDSWTWFGKLTVPRDHFSACVWRGKIVIAGGIHNRPNLEKKNNFRFNHQLQKWFEVPRRKSIVTPEVISREITCVEMYDFEKGTWEQICPTSSSSMTSTHNILVVL